MVRRIKGFNAYVDSLDDVQGIAHCFSPDIVYSVHIGNIKVAEVINRGYTYEDGVSTFNFDIKEVL